MDPYFSLAPWAALGSIILANIVLSGDNAVVIAMAARKLPDGQRQRPCSGVRRCHRDADHPDADRSAVAAAALPEDRRRLPARHIGVQLMAEGDEDDAGDGHDGGKGKA